MTNIKTWSAVRSYWNTGKTLFLYVILGKAVSFVWKLILGRLGAETLGATEITLAILYTLQAFSLLGLQMPLMRYTTKYANRRERDTYFFLTLRIVSFISLLIILFGYAFPDIIASWFGKTTDIARISLQYVFLIPLIAASELIWTQWASRKHVALYAFGKYTLPPISRLVMILIVILLGVRVPAVVAHVAFAGLITFMVSAMLSGKIIRFPTQSLTKEHAHEFVRYSTPVAGSFLLFSLYGASDVLFTSRFLGAESVGLLSIAVLFADIPSVVLTPLLNVFQTHLGTYKTMGQARMFGFANIRILSILGACFVLAGMLFFPYLIPGVMGAEYSDVVRVAQLLLAGTATETAIILPMRHLLDYYGHTSATLASMAITACIKILILTLTIPHFGLMGVVYAQWAAVSTHAILIIVANAFLTPSRTASESR